MLLVGNLNSLGERALNFKINKLNFITFGVNFNFHETLVLFHEL